mmetsp:Transcript_61711/g.133707  ORF Transcript_61711/g.133707 Transcript_61711/m.133707 type:complete len:345 (-) Transcript_61711:123-1157(-)
MSIFRSTKDLESLDRHEVNLESDSDVEELETENFGEDTYGMASVAIIRDLQRIQRQTGTKHKKMRLMRIVVSVLLLLVNIGLQIFLMKEIKRFVTAKAVHDIRDVYGTFEKTMYTETYLTIHGKPRGVSGYNISKFSDLTDEEHRHVCRIPFSQPAFFLVITSIWSLTVMGDIKATWLNFFRLIYKMPTIGNMENATKTQDSDEVVVGLSRTVKALLCIFTIIPRFVIACILLWLGCRWLAATESFSDLLLNAVALEFILLMKDLLYNTLVPGRNKRETRRTTMDINYETNHPTIATFFGSFIWGFIVAAWVILYFYKLQRVLPDYKFDVHEACKEWIAQRYAV